MIFFVALVKCSEIAHNSMFKSVLKAPIYFFDTNPVGRYYFRAILWKAIVPNRIEFAINYVNFSKISILIL